MTNTPILGEERIFIPGPTGKIEALAYGIENITPGEDAHLKPEMNSKTIGVVCHPHPLFQGTMYNKVVTTICKTWQDLGIPTLRFNFRGVGESEGKYDDSIGEILDLGAVLHFLQNHFPGISFYLGGFSFGSYIALKVAMQPQIFPIRALLSVAPPVHHFAFNTINAPNCPWIVIQGTKDSIVPYENVSEWVAKMHSQTSDLEFITMDGAEHFFHGQLLNLKTIIQDYFRKLLQE